jgi:hypothetical protein
MNAQVDYSPGFFLPQAKAWADQAHTMGVAAADSAVLQVNGGDIWPFAGAVAAYNQVSGKFSTWCQQGEQQMTAICDALCLAARRYGATEDQLIQASDGTFH